MMKSEEEPPGVVVLYSASDKLLKGESRDLLAEQGVIACAQAIADALRKADYQVAQVPIHSDVELALAPYSPTRWAVFNLGEGLEGRLFEEARIAWALEAMGYRSSICKHAGATVTVFSIIINLNELRAWIGRGRPCQTTYTEHTLDPWTPPEDWP